MPGWRIFQIKEVPFVRVSLRRYKSSEKAKCPTPHGYHDAMVLIEPQRPEELENGYVRFHRPEEYKDDPRWPAACACGYAFAAEDERQVFVDLLYKGSPDGKLHGLRDPDLIPGAAWDATWMPEGFRYSDGRAWVIRMPGESEWIVQGPSKDGGKWKVTGAMPSITAHPSIHLVGVYHGFIRDGVITPDCDGRQFPATPYTA